MKQITREWFQAAYDDILIIEEIIDKEYLSHIVAFHAQQAIEKSFKAVLEEYTDNVPKIHQLERLSSLVSSCLDIEFDEENDFFEELDKLYIDARYPGEFGLLPQGKPSLDDAKRFYDLAHGLYDFLQDRLL
ncbi:HEPN domain-containing protein [Desulfovermiculus halophilus]|jgi:HEPN domain-containing protein|uniref:HEPN domain-containing protein n=1 Tax=Desulfovermiculus halophilus TaxID=339722 RepID=UPI00048638BE|nr:HEPN domain-containing protein [Desulfovermiculus halophilus]